MRVKTDENFHPEVAEFLRKHGHDAITVWDENLQGSDDSRLIGRCQLEKRALLTLDVGFGNIRSYPPGDHFGIVVLRLENQGRRRVLALLPRVLELIHTEPIEKHLWVVDESTVRIRGREPDPGEP